MSKPFCRRCLLAEMPDQAELAAVIRERISLMPPEQRADDALVEVRLGACRGCDYLHDGTCALCGCYVELRTARKPMHCPDVPARW